MPKSGLSATQVLKTLRENYNPPRTFLYFRTPLDLLIATVLSAQCTDARVNVVTETILYPKYKTVDDYLKTPRSELEDDVHSCGTYRAKAKYIHGICEILKREHGGKVPQTLAELVKLPGVGRKTAAVVLWAAFKKNEAFAVDTHVMRVAKRLGLTRHKEQGKIELDLMKALPPNDWGYMTTHLISHGRAVCTARNRACGRCVFQKMCPSSRVMGRPDLAADKGKRGK